MPSVWSQELERRPGYSAVLVPVSHSHRFVYIHIPKTAGTSVMQTLASGGAEMRFNSAGLWDAILGHPDNARLVEQYRRVFHLGTLSYAQQQHLPASVLRELVPRAQWDGYFKFAFVRNPWDMLVSGYRYQTTVLTPEQRALNPDVAELLARTRDFSDVVRYYPMIRSDMTSFITDEHGQVIVDFVGRFERLEEDFAYICSRIGIDARLSHENRSERAASYREYYTEETRDIVARHFARDIERFGYRF